MAQTYRRRRKLIKPGLQLRLSARFLGLAVLIMGLQFVLLQAILNRVAGELPADGGLLIEQSSGIGLELIGWSAVVFLPLTVLVGIIGSFKIAGPLYRFEVFLRALLEGQQPEDIRLRAGDELKDVAALLSDATRPLREDQASADRAPSGPGEPNQAAA